MIAGKDELRVNKYKVINFKIMVPRLMPLLTYDNPSLTGGGSQLPTQCYVFASFDNGYLIRPKANQN